MSFWQPQLGPQLKAVTCPVDFVFFGGSRGGGKSDALIGRQIAGVDQYANHWNGLIIRRKYKDFRELRRRWDELIANGLPAVRIGGENQTNYLNFSCGAKVTMPAINVLKQVNDFVGHQYTEISVDECTTFPFFAKMVDKLKGSLRSPHGVPCHMFGTGNPGGPGHNSVKEYFQLGKNGVPPETVITKDLGEGLSETRIFIPSFLDDNKILCENDPLYVARLKSINDPALRKAWIDGDWDVFIGQAFAFNEMEHTVPPIKIPQNAPIYTTFDWGFGKPFSWGWWWVDNDGRLFRFAEWYGFNGVEDEGLRIVDSDIASGIKEREEKLGINKSQIKLRLAGHDCWNKKPDYKGGGQGKSTAEIFSEHGLYLTKADSNRELKIRQFRERLAVPDDHTMPMLMVYKTCKNFIRTIPSLVMDEDNPEDIDTAQEDHCFIGSTEVITASGIQRLKDMVGTTGGILTLCGNFENYCNCREIKTSTSLVRLEFSDGSCCTCTEDHEFLTVDGLWKMAIDLLDEECYCSINIPNQEEGLCGSISSVERSKSLTANVIISVVATIKKRVSGFTGLFGSTTMARYLPALKYITQNTIQIKTKLKTWKSKAMQAIDRIMQNATTTPHGFQPCTKGLQSGMEAKRVDGGTKNNLKSIAGSHSQRQCEKPVFNVDLDSSVKNIQNIVPINARLFGGLKTLSVQKKERARYVSRYSRFFGQAVSNYVQRVVLQYSGGMALRVVSIKRAESEPVYCLTVPTVHCFTLSNGVVVSNCYDEACQICMARPLNLTRPASQAPEHEKRIEELYKGGTGDDFEDFAIKEQDQAMRHLGQQPLIDRVDKFDDSGGYDGNRGDVIDTL